ncbi:MFS transporter [Paenibacillus alginolyticus]|uniref:MFS transporter n=1 Tax=Paenibacillus alginolyticus TaxID=59839 RepID=UPI00406BC0A2
MVDNSWKRNLFVLWVGTFLVSMAYTVSIPFMSLFLQDDLGVQSHLELWTGVVFAITFLAAALIAPFWGSLADKYGRKPMMLRAGICLSIAYFLYFIVQNPYELILIRIMEGLLAGYIPSAIALVATNTPEKHVGYALGIISTSSATASILGPLLGGVVSHLIGTRETFLLAGVMVLIAFVIAWVWVKEPSFVKSEAKRSAVLNDLKEAATNPYGTGLSQPCVQPESISQSNGPATGSANWRLSRNPIVNSRRVRHQRLPVIAGRCSAQAAEVFFPAQYIRNQGDVEISLLSHSVWEEIRTVISERLKFLNNDNSITTQRQPTHQ